MAPLKPLFRRLFESDSERVVLECRDCGTSVETDEEPCPSCGSDNIVTHRLE